MVKCFYNTVLKFDFINKFNYLDISNIPNFVEVCLTFQADNLKNMLLHLITLKLFSNKNSRLLLSFKNGNVIVSKVFVKKKLLNKVLLILTGKILPYIRLSNFLTFYFHDIELIKKLFKFPNFINFTKFKMIIIFRINNKQELRFIVKNCLLASG